MLLEAADDDVFVSDALRLAEKSKAAGVVVELKVWKKMWHNFQMTPSLLLEARQVLGEVCAFVAGVQRWL